MKVKESSLMIMLLITIGVSILLAGANLVVIDGLLSTILTIVGIAVAALGLVELCDKELVPGLIKMVVGLALVLISKFAMDILIYVLAALLIAYGIYQIILAIKGDKKGLLMALIVPVLCIVAGILLIVAKVATIEIMLTIFAILLLVAAAFFLIKDHILAK